MSRFTDHSVKTNESLGRRFCRALDENDDSKTEVFRRAIIEYVEPVEGETVESIERRIDELREEKREYEEERKRAARRETSMEARIDDLESRLDDLRSDGDHDGLFDDLVDSARRGADLRTIHEKTDKFERLRALGSYESIEAAIEAVKSTMKAGDDR